MARHYPAILRGDRLEWLSGSPPEGDGARVDVVVPDPQAPLPGGITGHDLVAILDELAKTNPFDEIEDPVEWQRREREDRPLP